MSGIFGKKQILLATLVLALGVAVYLNYYFSAKQPDVVGTGAKVTTTTTKGNLGNAQYVNAPSTTIVGTTPSGNAADYFVQARKNRETARNEALGLIKDLMNDVKASDAMKQEALEKTVAIAANLEQESKIESLVKAKGFADCVAYIEGTTCHIVVRSDGLQPQEAVQITDIITGQSSVPAQSINIETVK